MNAITWFEIPVVQFERALSFYNTIFGIQLKIDEGFPGLRMGVFPGAEEGGVSGCIQTGPLNHPSEQGVLVYLNASEGVDKVLERVASAGGKVLAEKSLLPNGAGEIAFIRDTEGNMIGLHSI